MKQTAIAPSNIAFIKYWGKKDEELRIPCNDSISMNLSGATTTTTVEFSPLFVKDAVECIDGKLTKQEIDRIVVHLDRIRVKAKITDRVRVVTENSFPKSAGIASSASGFAALTAAAAAAAGLTLSEKELSTLARLGSGSACRSIPDGFVQWVAGDTSETSYAYSLFPHTHWDIRDILVVVNNKTKEVASTEGMKNVEMSPFWRARHEGIEERIKTLKQALEEKNFSLFGETVEEDCLSMHVVMMTQDPPLYYWDSRTIEILTNVLEWRKRGIPVYFTVDAGPNVHLLCEGKDEERVQDAVFGLSAVQSIIVNKPAPGAHMTDDHLF
jgi:diphosphomevalonate decarboxylase